MSTDCVILAAGVSSRCGQNNKLTLKLNGKTIIERVCAAFYPSCKNIFVVTGFYEKDIREALKLYDKIRFVHNPDFEKGMFTSIKKGVAEVESSKFLITPGDCPLLTPQIVNKLNHYNSKTVIPTYEGVRGHPVLVNKSLVPGILSSRENSMRETLSKFPHEFKKVNNAGIITDVDTIEDFEKVKLMLSRG